MFHFEFISQFFLPKVLDNEQSQVPTRYLSKKNLAVTIITGLSVMKHFCLYSVHEHQLLQGVKEQLSNKHYASP
jgi:hypothetical protein